MPLTETEVQRRLAELEEAGNQQMMRNQPGAMSPRDLSALDLGAQQAMQRIEAARAAAPAVNTQMQVGPSQPMAPPMRQPVPQGVAQMPPIGPQPGPMQPRSLSGLRRPMTAVRGY